MDVVFDTREGLMIMSREESMIGVCATFYNRDRFHMGHFM